VGSGQEISIKELAHMIKRIVGYTGLLKLDTTKPDGPPRKLMDSTKINELGWKASIGLEEGITATYQEFQTLKEYRDK
jgi:GDP-L-fucose synthase